MRHIFNLMFNSHTDETFRHKWPDVLKSVFFRNLFSPVSDRGPRRTTDDDCNFFLMPLKYSDLFYYPVPKIISNWNSVPLNHSMSRFKFRNLSQGHLFTKLLSMSLSLSLSQKYISEKVQKIIIIIIQVWPLESHSLTLNCVKILSVKCFFVCVYQTLM